MRRFFPPDLVVRPKGPIKGDRLTLLVTPRKIPYNLKKRQHSNVLIGVLEVPMRKEYGDWRVDLHAKT